MDMVPHAVDVDSVLMGAINWQVDEMLVLASSRGRAIRVGVAGLRTEPATRRYGHFSVPDFDRVLVQAISAGDAAIMLVPTFERGRGVVGVLPCGTNRDEVGMAREILDR